MPKIVVEYDVPRLVLGKVKKALYPGPMKKVDNFYLFICIELEILRN